MNQYRKSNRFPVPELEYLALECVDKNNVEMDYLMLFEKLQKCGYPINEKSIRIMPIFNYIQVSDQLKTKIFKYKLTHLTKPKIIFDEK